MGSRTLLGLSCGQGLKSRLPLLPTLSYASANRRSRRVTYPTVCSKRATLLGNANGPTVCAGTERDNGMLSGQLFGPGGNTTLEYWIDGRRIRAAWKAPQRKRPCRSRDRKSVV